MPTTLPSRRPRPTAKSQRLCTRVEPKLAAAFDELCRSRNEPSARVLRDALHAYVPASFYKAAAHRGTAKAPAKPAGKRLAVRRLKALAR